MKAKEYTIEKTTAASLEAVNWDAVSPAVLEETGWLPLSGIHARAKACFCDDKLFLCLEAEEKNIRAKETETLSMVCFDSCLEFFYAPREEDPRYFNIEWNPVGNLYLGFGTGRAQHVRQILDQKDEILHPLPSYTDHGWKICFQIPLSFLQLYFPELSFTGRACGNFYKCGDETETPHYLAWSALTTDKPDFHRRNDFGTLIFDNK